jgi:regulator of protease activity HflC (stomatin/prohibitin superfamily)
VWIRQTFCLGVGALLVHALLLLSLTSTWAQEAPTRGHLGVFLQNAPRPRDATDAATREGVVTLGVMRGSPAEQAGLRRGDVILTYNGQALREVEDLQRQIAATPIGEIVELQISRRDQVLQLPVRIDATPISPPVGGSPTVLPLVFPQDQLLWLVLGGAALSLFLVYLTSVRPWQRWRLTRATTMIEHAGQVHISRPKVMFLSMGLVMMVLSWSCLTMIDVGHQGVVFHMLGGVRDTPLTEGVHFLLPGVNRVTIYDMRSRVYHVQGHVAPEGRSPSQSPDHLLWTPTADGLKVGLDLSVRYRLDPGRLPDLHRSVGPEFEGKIVHPVVWNVTRLVASEYSLLDIYGKRRHELQQQALSRVQAMFARDGLIAEDLLLRDVVYTKEFEKTLVAKMIAEQRVQESTFEVLQAELQAQAHVLEAEGEARALELVNRAINDQPLILQYLWIRNLPERLKIIVVPHQSGKSRPRVVPEQPESQQAQTEADGG